MRKLALGVVLSVAGIAAGCGGGDGYGSDGGSPAACTPASATATTSVSLAGMQFSPSCIRISPGATVTFTNVDTMAHTVTTLAGQPETFDSGNIAAAGTFTHTFASTAETVAVRCTLHPSMTATIIVQ